MKTYRMKKILLLTLLCFSINAAAINWQKVGEASGNSLYVDVDNIKKQNKFVYYWELVDFKEAIFGAYSSISKFKADCVDKKKALLIFNSYTGPMGKFRLINEATYDGTRFSDASHSIEMKFACDRAK